MASVWQCTRCGVLASGLCLLVLAMHYGLQLAGTSDRSQYADVRVDHSIRLADDLQAHLLSQIHSLRADQESMHMSPGDHEGLSLRSEHIRNVCKTLNMTELADSSWRQHLHFYRKSNILYCSVAKAASKFWSRMLLVLEEGFHTSPFQFNRAKLSRGITLHEQQDLKPMTFLFSRDPYRRIFSSYVDKLVSPNPVYWFSFGRSVQHHSNRTTTCGQDVQFHELVHFLVHHDVHKYDYHFKPASTSCNVCNTTFDVIGKVETFKRDLAFMLNSTNAFHKGVVFKDFSREKNNHYIIFKVIRLFEGKHLAMKCMSEHVLFVRLWRVLQISGLIDKHFAYPLSPEESRQVNQTTMINLLLNAHGRSTSGAKLNKEESLLQAYSQIPTQDLEQLRLKYMNDFLLFGYNDRPSYIFNRNTAHEANFDFFDVLNFT